MLRAPGMQSREVMADPQAERALVEAGLFFLARALQPCLPKTCLGDSSHEPLSDTVFVD